MAHRVRRPGGRPYLIAALILLQLSAVAAGQVIAEAPTVIGLGTLHAVAFSPDGRYIATGGGRGVVLWDAATHEVVRVLEAPPAWPETDYGGPFMIGLSFSPSSTHVAALYSGYRVDLSSESPVAVWEVASGKPISATGAESEDRWLESAMAWFEGEPVQVFQSWGSGFLGDQDIEVDAEALDGNLLAISADGALLVTYDEGRVDIRRVADTALVSSFSADLAGYGITTFSPDNKYFAFGTYGPFRDDGLGNNRIEVWSVETGKRLATITRPAEQGWLWSLTFSPDGNTLAVAWAPEWTEWYYRKDALISASLVQLVDVRAGRAVGSLEGHAAFPGALVFSPDSQRLTVFSDQDRLAIYELGERPLELAVTAKLSRGPWLGRPRFGDNGRTLILYESGDSKTFVLVDTETGEVRDRLSYHADQAVLGPDFKLVATVPSSKTLPGDQVIEIWHTARSEQPLRTFVLDSRPEDETTTYVSDLLFSPDGARLAALVGRSSRRYEYSIEEQRTVSRSVFDDRLMVWHSGSGELLMDLPVTLPKPDPEDASEMLPEYVAYPRELVFSPDGWVLAAYIPPAPAICYECYDPGGSSLILWDTRTGEQLAAAVHGFLGTHIAFTTDSRWLISDAGLFNTRSGERLCQPKTGRAVAVSAEADLFATGNEDGEIRLYDLPSCTYLAPLPGHTDWVDELEFSSDGRWLASRSRDGTVRVWPIVR